VSVSSPRTGTCRGALGHVGGGVTRRVGGCVVRGAWGGCLAATGVCSKCSKCSRAAGGGIAAGVAATRRQTDDEQLSKASP
jgi:hypothetical protein